MLLKAALNGDRQPSNQSAVPKTPSQLAEDGKIAVSLGCGALHVHPRNADGFESLAWFDIEPTIVAIREACPGIPIGISSRDGITATAEERFALVSDWKDQIDFVSVNFHEDGSVDVARKLRELNIGVEAGLFSPQGAQNLLKSGFAEDCLRIMFEPMDSDFEAAIQTVNDIEKVLDKGRVANPSRLLHGFDSTTWKMLAEAKKRGYDSRIGFEDTIFLPDGRLAKTNAELVQKANEILGNQA